MDTKKDELADITAQKSLWQVYKEARKLPTKKINYILPLLCAACLGALLTIYPASAKKMLTHTEGLLEFGFSFALSILGFLVAGIAIFTSFSRKEMFKRIATVTDPNTNNLSFLKSFFFSFMLVFIHYLIFIFISAFALMLLPLSYSYKLLLGHTYQLGIPLLNLKLFASAVYVIYCAWLLFLIMLLKSFIYNLYNIIMTSIRYDLEEENGSI